MILAFGVGLIVFDVVATTYLVVQRFRLRRRERVPAATSPAPVERPPGCEHPSRSVMLDPPRVPRMRPTTLAATSPGRQAAIQPLLDIWEDAEMLAALQRLSYDPATWET